MLTYRHSLNQKGLRFLLLGNYEANDGIWCPVYMSAVIVISPGQNYGKLDFLPTDVVHMFCSETQDSLSPESAQEMIYNAIFWDRRCRCDDEVRSKMRQIALSKFDEHLAQMSFPVNLDKIIFLKRYITSQVGRLCDMHQSKAELDKATEIESWSRYYNTKAKIIQNAWRRAIACPYTSACRHRLIREFSELVAEHA